MKTDMKTYAAFNTITGKFFILRDDSFTGSLAGSFTETILSASRLDFRQLAVVRAQFVDTSHVEFEEPNPLEALLDRIAKLEAQMGAETMPESWAEKMGERIEKEVENYTMPESWAEEMGERIEKEVEDYVDNFDFSEAVEAALNDCNPETAVAIVKLGLAKLVN